MTADVVSKGGPDPREAEFGKIVEPNVLGKREQVNSKKHEWL